VRLNVPGQVWNFKTALAFNSSNPTIAEIKMRGVLLWAVGIPLPLIILERVEISVNQGIHKSVWF
jgi:hypothetical protein